jgi:transmembrane sensor
MKVNSLNAQIYSEASDWLIEFRSGDIDAQGRKTFYHWLRTSPEHMRAYLELAAIWNEGHGLDRNRHFDDARLSADLQSENNVTSLELPSAHAGLQRALVAPSRRKRPPWVAFAAGLLLAFIGIGCWYEYFRDTFATGIGQTRRFSLVDGSTIELDAESTVRVEFSKDSRNVRLLEGQALFHVAKDHRRPFVVQTENTRVRAVGTQFDVFRTDAATTVTVVEGTVAVLPAAFDLASDPSANVGSVQSRPVPNTLMLSAGDQVTIAPALQPKSAKADVASATAWTQHELVFKGASLHEVATQFNRYNKRQIIIRDASISDLKVTGIFSSTDPSSLLRFLEARSEIAVAVMSVFI